MRPTIPTLKLILSLLLTGIFTTGCESFPKFKNYEKEHNNPQDTRYEAPYTQLREKSEDMPKSSYAPETIPQEDNREPVVIEPTPYLPGKSPILSGIALKGKDGFVLSPYAPDKGLVDVRGFPAGTDVRDPYTGKIMKVPIPPPADKKPAQTNTLSEPANQTPETNNPNTGAPSLEP